MRRLTLSIAAAICCSWLSVAAASNDAAVLAVFKKADSSLAFAKVWRRVDVGDGQDLVVTIGSPRRWPLEFFGDGRIWWGQRSVGLFLQNHKNPGTVYQLAAAPGTGCDTASVARATRTDTVIWCDAEKSEVQAAHKFVYDVRAKRLVSKFEFEPFTNITATHVANGQISLTATRSDRRVTLTLTPPATFAVTRDQRWQRPESIYSDPLLKMRFGPRGAFRLVVIPDSETENCADPVVAVLANGRRHRLTGKECGRIGPNHEAGERLWFGTTFYNGEGSGTLNSGGFGYFDTRTLTFQTFSSREIARWSTSAIHAAGESVWLALESRGEYGNTTGGVLVYPSPESKPRHIDIGHCVGREFVASGENLYLITECGVVLLSADSVSGYMIDVTTDGRVRVVPGLP